MKKHVIWSNDYDTIHSLEEDIINGNLLLDYENLDSAWENACSINDDYLDDERANLSVKIGTEIILIGRLGLWDGRHMGYKELHSRKISDCLSGTMGDYVTWYVDERGDLMCEDIHHDGTNVYTYRAWKHDVSDRQKENFLDKVYRGVATRKDITRYTRKLGPYIASVYGW